MKIFVDLWLLSAKAQAFLRSDFTFMGIAGSCGNGDHESGPEKLSNERLMVYKSILPKILTLPFRKIEL